MDKSLDLKDRECKIHSMNIHSICTYENCEDMYLCDICMNLHNKEHKYIVSVNSIKNNVFENIIEKNEEKSKKNEENINNIYDEFQNKIESDIRIFKENVLSMIDKFKLSLLEWLENHKQTQLEEINIWTKMKFEYCKSYMEYLNSEQISEGSLEHRNSNQNIFMNLNHNYSSFLDNSIRDESISNFKNFLNVINKIIHKQIYHFNTNSIFNSNCPNSLIGDLNNQILENIKSKMSQFRIDVKKLIDEKFFFSNSVNEFISHSEILDESSPKFICKDRSSISKLTLNRYQRITPSPQRNVYRSPDIRNMKKGNLNPNSRNNSLLDSVSLPKTILPHNQHPEKIQVTSKDILLEKKGLWYTIEHIEDLNYVIVGYQTGEIIIFKESDLTLIRTFRPRFKRVRKIIYSQENSSIFACYDDGYLIVINMINYKISSYKISANQVYAMEIMHNYNILIFGGVEKKIMFSYIINLDKILLFHESTDGEVQSLIYDEKKDILVCGFRKQCIGFFNYNENKILYKYEFNKEDCCAMVLKKHKEDLVLASGYFLNIAVFKLKDQGAEHCYNIECGFLHFYDLIFFEENHLFVSTFDENKLVIVDFKNRTFIKAYDNFKGIIQLKFINNFLYVSSHSDCLKKISFS